MSPASRAVSHLAPPPPPAHLDSFPQRQHPEGVTAFRSHTHGKGAWWFSNSGAGRFDLTATEGTCYLAESEIVTLLEVWGGLRVVPDYIAAQRDTSRLAVRGGLRLADLTCNLAVQYGITSEIFTTTDYAVTQLWASALRRAGFNGIRYWARHDLAHTAACLALFGTAGPGEPTAGFDVEATEHLPERGDLLAQLEKETGITVLSVPPL